MSIYEPKTNLIKSLYTPSPAENRGLFILLREDGFCFGFLNYTLDDRTHKFCGPNLGVVENSVVELLSAKY